MADGGRCGFHKAALQGYSLITSVSMRRLPALGDDIFIGAARSSAVLSSAGALPRPAALLVASSTTTSSTSSCYSSSTRCAWISWARQALRRAPGRALWISAPSITLLAREGTIANSSRLHSSTLATRTSVPDDKVKQRYIQRTERPRERDRETDREHERASARAKKGGRERERETDARTSRDTRRREGKENKKNKDANDRPVDRPDLTRFALAEGRVTRGEKSRQRSRFDTGERDVE